MTEGTSRTLGLDRPLRLEWLDAAAGRLAAGDTPKAAREYLWDLLAGTVAGNTPQTARGKTLTVLSRIWLTPPAEMLSLRDAGLRALADASTDERVAIHWAMVCAAYPFFVDVAGLVGKSLTLNGEVALSQLIRRLVDLWGDRSTLRAAAQRLMRSMVQWGALREGERAGMFLALPKKLAIGPSVGQLVVEGLLIGEHRGMPLGQLLSHPASFPFDVRVDLTGLRRSGRLQVHRQGDLSDFVEATYRPTPKEAPEPRSRANQGRAVGTQVPPIGQRKGRRRA